MKNTLVPEYRTDKNGRSVLRHVKAQKAPAKPIPKITAATKKVPAKTHQQLIREASTVLATSVRQVYSEKAAKQTREAARSALEDMSASTVSRIKDHDWTPDSAFTLGKRLGKGWNETKVNDYFALSSVIGIPGIEVVSDANLDPYFLYPDLCPPNNEGDYPEERLSQIVALHEVVEQMWGSPDHDPTYSDESTGARYYYIPYPELRELVLHPGEKYSRESVVNVIKDHNTFDAARIRAILDFSVPSLNGGVL